MITYQLTVNDLADMRFAYSPLLETATSLWALRWPERYVLHLPWIRRARAALADAPGARLEILDGLLGAERGWLPDFVTPRPETPLPEFADELQRVRDTPVTSAVTDFRAVYGRHPLPAVTDPAVVADTLHWYWQLAIEPYWPRMRAVLEADMLHRARLLARDGAGGVLVELDRRARLTDGYLRLYAGHALDYDVDVAGRGLWLVPALFLPQTVSPVGPDQPPTVAYPARGIGTLWESAPSRPPEAVSDLIGAARAGLLTAIDGPVSTTELARRLGVTPGAVSQHLGVLLRAGLLSRARAGRVVLYVRTDLAEQLLQGGPAGGKATDDTDKVHPVPGKSG
ncbi:helix-turn-helix domain-containing protein [Micromonospora sp. NBC_00617]|uniref:ArsR/SmtB family transcription factor n=1 Tax=Micromonospora sp. NBC_00617 TaxID=2903587 RepID=UPI0030E2A916